MPRKKVKEVMVENEPVQVKEEIPKSKKVKEKPNVAPVKEQNSDDDIDANTLDYMGSNILKGARKLKKEESSLSHRQAVALSMILFNKNKNKKYKA